MISFWGALVALAGLLSQNQARDFSKLKIWLGKSIGSLVAGSKRSWTWIGSLHPGTLFFAGVLLGMLLVLTWAIGAPVFSPTNTPMPALASTCVPGREAQIPAGYFLMGSDDEYFDARPQRQVYVEAFCIDKYEVSNEGYKQFVDATGHRVPYVEADWADPYNWDPVTRAYPAGKARYPVVLISWYDAQAYCRWAGKRLPTETEWEKAARGADGRRYPWGNEWDHTKANTFESGRGEASPVGMYHEGASAYGILDMAGNVWEWTEGKYEPSPGNPDWTEMFEKDRRVLRGGSWRETGKVRRKSHPGGPVSVSYGSVTTAFRCPAVPDDRLDDVGFRCARSAVTR